MSNIIKFPSELQECRAYWEWAQHIPLLRDNLIHIPNEGKRSAISGKSLKSIGLRKGVSDYFLPVPKYGYHGFWLEMKCKPAHVKKPSIEQLKWIIKMRDFGYNSFIAYGCDEAINATNLYLMLPSFDLTTP